MPLYRRSPSRATTALHIFQTLATVTALNSTWPMSSTRNSETRALDAAAASVLALAVGHQRIAAAVHQDEWPRSLERS